jgi:hypothetical protein
MLASRPALCRSDFRVSDLFHGEPLPASNLQDGLHCDNFARAIDPVTKVVRALRKQVSSAGNGGGSQFRLTIGRQSDGTFGPLRFTVDTQLHLLQQPLPDVGQSVSSCGAILETKGISQMECMLRLNAQFYTEG